MLCANVQFALICLALHVSAVIAAAGPINPDCTYREEEEDRGGGGQIEDSKEERMQGRELQ